jgi:hypothetical protein
VNGRKTLLKKGHASQKTKLRKKDNLKIFKIGNNTSEKHGINAYNKFDEK